MMTATTGNNQSNGTDMQLHQHQQHVEEEVWEEPVEFAVTPHSCRRILLPYNFATDNQHNQYITIQSVDTTQMSLLDVCNYKEDGDPQVDETGHCIWMGALFFVQALSIGMATSSASTGTSSSLSSWYHSEYFHDKQVAEIGCGTGTAGIALLSLLTTTIRHMLFLDNDPQALELCRQNCQQNGIPESLYTIKQQGSWLDSNNSPPLPIVIDTILATDVLYDLKIIRPFFQTVARLLLDDNHNASTTATATCGDVTETHNNDSHKNDHHNTSDNNLDSVNKKKHLILSHVPRWFLPRHEGDSNGGEPYNQRSALEEHIIQEALRCGLVVVSTERPMNVLVQCKAMMNDVNGDHLASQHKPFGDDDAGNKANLREDLQEMDQAGAVLWVFEKQR